MASKTFENVEVWQRAHKWVLGIYKSSEGFPKQEMSVPANFAEGFKKVGLSDKLRFYNIAQGSLEECHIIWCSRETWVTERPMF